MLFKRLAASIAAPVLVLGMLPAHAFAAEETPAVTVPSAILVERSTGRALFEKDADVRRAPASITKIMTLLLVMEALDGGRISPDESVTCSEYASSMGGSQIWLEPYEQMTVHELLKATAVASANDAAVALAEHLSGSEEAFVEEMNRHAAALGMSGTNFVNCTGLDEEGHYTTARDIAKMAAALLEHRKILDYTGIWMDELRAGETQLVNTNRLIVQYPGATGLKTGSTDNAGKCLCASAERDGMELVSVILGAPESDAQFGQSRLLLDWGFDTFMSVPVRLPEGALSALRVEHGVSPEVEVYADGPENVIIERADEGKLGYEVTLSPSVQAPVENNQTVGEVLVHVDSEEVCTFPVLTKNAVARMTFPRAAGRLFGSLFSVDNTGAMG